jgi:hypothetical protein
MRGTTTTTFLLGDRGRGRAGIDMSFCLCGGTFRHQLRVGLVLFEAMNGFSRGLT